MILKIEYPEGATPLDPDEAEGLKHKHVTTRGELDHLEQANIEAGLQWLARARKIDPLDETFLRTLHRHLFGDVWDWAGTFRKTEKNIGVDPYQIQVQLRVLMDDTRYWIENGTYSAMEIAARFHHKLVQIHVFPNGNGRHARIAADLLVARVLKTRPIDWAAGYELQSMNVRREAYINALRAADKHDYELLYRFIKVTDRT